MKELTNWMIDGKLVFKEDIREGLENAPSALLDLFNGGNTGKLGEAIDSLCVPLE